MWRRISSVVLWLVTFALFVFSCFCTAADGQGAIVFIFFTPVMVVCLVAMPFIDKASKLVSRASLAGLALFFVTVFIPPLRFIPRAAIGAVSAVFEWQTGMSPYAWTRK